MLAGLLLLLLLSAVPSANAGSIITTKYDNLFKDAVIFLPVGSDWRLLKAQCYQESRLDPFAISPVGAYGLCQFMPNTAKELKNKYPELQDFYLPETSIIAAAIYMNQQLKFWSAPRSDIDRYMLALASYNAGAGNVYKAQKLAGKVNAYLPIINKLPKVTGKNSNETIKYVKYIVGKWYVLFLFE